MHATSERRRLRAHIDEEAFSRLIKVFHGDLKDHEIGALFDMDDSEWSLVKNGKRELPKHFLPICMFELFPDIPPRTYMRPGTAIRRGEVTA